MKQSLIRFYEITPKQLYSEKVKLGKIKKDLKQIKIINQFEEVYKAIQENKNNNYHHQWFKNLFRPSYTSLKPIPSNIPSGIYLYGTVGTGKTMLMDLFYDSIKTLNQIKLLTAKRIHFHQFMVDIHQKNHKLQQEQIHLGQLGQADVLVSIAKSISNECRVLCFDEFQVTDIVDAMILKRLLEALLSYGVVVVLTSNRHPDELYKNGIQRESFLGCIELIKKHMKVIDLNSGHDYRSENIIDENEQEQTKNSNLKKIQVFLNPINQANQIEFKSRFDKINQNIDSNELIIKNRKLSIWGTRSISVPISTSNVAWFDFNNLCNLPPLSAADYLKIVTQFQVIFVNNVPRLSIHQRDMARRFILFLDAAYESKTKLITLSEVPITEIFSTQDDDNSNSSSENQITSVMRATVDDLGLDSNTIGKSSLFSGEEERFAWARAVSRLNEMSSNRWPTYSLLDKLDLNLNQFSSNQNEEITHNNNNSIEDLTFVDLHNSPPQPPAKTNVLTHP